MGTIIKLSDKLSRILEDFEDVKDAMLRRNETDYSFDDLVKQLKAENLF